MNMTLTGYDRERAISGLTVKSEDFGVLVYEVNELTVPARDVTIVQVPGRNGDLTLDNGRWNNVDVEFRGVAWLEAGDSKSAEEKVRDFLAAANAFSGYVQIRTYAAGNFIRYGTLKDAETVWVTGSEYEQRGRRCKFRLVFNCKPQRYDAEGFNELTCPAGGSIALNNPYRFRAKPLIRMNSGGTVTIGSLSVQFSPEGGYPGWTMIDCEAGSAYMNGVNTNPYVTTSATSIWPSIGPGASTLTNSTGAAVTIQPRWWTL